jgi:predicted ATPase
MIVDSDAIDKVLWRCSQAAGGCRIAILTSERKVALMAGETARRAPMMSLQELYRVYAAIAAKPGEPVPLSAFKLPREEMEKLFSIFDEDYHISRFFHFSAAAGEKYLIDGENVTHVAIDAEISSIL